MIAHSICRHGLNFTSILTVATHLLLRHTHIYPNDPNYIKLVYQFYEANEFIDRTLKLMHIKVIVAVANENIMYP